jgi:putative transposase
MQLVKQYRIDRHDPRWAAIDTAAFASKNLYNAVLYLTRQAYIKDHIILGYGELDRLPQATEEYRALPAKVAQWVLKQVCLAWTGYSASCRDWEAHPEKFLGHPKLPQYRDKQGRNLLTYTIQAISQHPKNRGWIVPSGLAVRVAIEQPFDAIAQVRIVPHATHSTVEVIYERAITRANLDAQWVAGIDLGVNNLAVITANQPGFTPILVNGRPLKALNQLYNKRRAHY